MLKSLYKKSELTFAIVWIVVYCVFMSIGDNLSASIGIDSSISFPVAAALSVILAVFIKKNRMAQKYGLCKAMVPASKMLYYIPLAVMLFANLMFGVKVNLSFAEAVLYILTMFCVGFLEEVIFRGLLFNAMAKDSVKAAVIVSSLTFGVGHLIRLFNGSGAELIPNLLQVVYAAAAGFMFVMIYLKSKSLIPCIAIHGLFNALSVFADESVLTANQRIISCVFLVAVSGFYGGYLALGTEKDNK